MDERLQEKIALNSFLQSHLDWLDPEKDKRLLVYDSESVFEDIFLYHDGDVEVNFSGIEFYEEHLKLKFYCFIMEEENTDVYVKNLRVNEQTIIKRRHIGSVSNCEYDYRSIEVYGTDDVAYADFSIIDLELEIDTDSYEPESSRKLYVMCNTRLQIFAVKIGTEKELLRFSGSDNIL